MELQVLMSASSQSQTPSQKRSFTDMHNATIDQEVANNSWYAIKPEEITVVVGDMCDKLTTPMEKYTSVDQGFQDLINAAKAAKKLPETKHCSVAVLGEQGIGKSSLVNALLDRSLLDRSGSSKACTAYATIIEYKPGAHDHTTGSDLSVEFFTKEEFRDCIKEQIDRWVEVYPFARQSAEPPDEEDEDDVDDGDATQAASEPSCRTRSRGAVTAKEFFDIIFEVRNEEARTKLEETLHHTDIKEGDFLDICCRTSDDRLSQLATQMNGINTQTRTAYFPNIPDKRLGRITGNIRKMWPFVKVFTIATGHILLRHGLRFFDLPGYGDTSQLREAVINNFRRKADYEMVVAPCSRLQTSVLQHKYIDRSIHLKGANKTILVMNKADEILNEDSMPTQIREIDEDPFIDLTDRLEAIEKQEDDEDSDKTIIAEKYEELLREATGAFIKYETANIQKQMQLKGIKVFSVSAMAYTALKNRVQKTNLMLDDDSIGIYALRHYLATLSSATNYKNFYDHVHEALPMFRRQASTPLENHIEDKSYAAMRHELKIEIQSLRGELKRRNDSRLQSLVVKPWSKTEEQNIICGILDLVETSWTHPRIYYSGFSKMLAENGIPVNGKYLGHNMNHDLLTVMKMYFDKWYNSLDETIGDFTRRLHRVVEKLLERTKSAITRSSAPPALRVKARVELSSVKQRIKAAKDTLLGCLHVSLGETHLNFTTEIDISCPIAVEMKACYARALDRTVVKSGEGIYNRQRNILQKSMIEGADHCATPGETLRPLLESIAAKVQDQQKRVWKTHCDTFVASTIEQLEGFSNTAEQLLMNPSYVTGRHKRARGELRKLLSDFDISLASLQSRFVSVEEEHAEKKARRDETEDEAPVTPPVSGPLVASVPVLENDGWIPPFGDGFDTDDGWLDNDVYLGF